MDAFTADDAITYLESLSPEQFDERMKINLARGGKFALMAKAMMGDEEAIAKLEQLISEKKVGPGFDLSSSEN